MGFNYQFDEPLWALVTGTMAERKYGIIRTVGQYLRNHHHVKVGITNNPSVRWSSHRKDGWEKMVVIYQSPRRTDAGRLEDVRGLEDAIVSHFFWSSCAVYRCHNQRAGGGGPLSTGDQFVYLLLSNKWRKRS